MSDLTKKKVKKTMKKVMEAQEKQWREKQRARRAQEAAQKKKDQTKARRATVIDRALFSTVVPDMHRKPKWTARAARRAPTRSFAAAWARKRGGARGTRRGGRENDPFEFPDSAGGNLARIVRVMEREEEGRRYHHGLHKADIDACEKKMRNCNQTAKTLMKMAAEFKRELKKCRSRGGRRRTRRRKHRKSRRKTRKQRGGARRRRRTRRRTRR